MRGVTSTERGSRMAGFGWGFTAVFRVVVRIAVAGAARDDAAGAAQAGGVCVGGAALDAAHAAVLGVVGEHGLAIVGRVAVAVSGTGRAILEAPSGGGIRGLGLGGLARAVRRNGHRDARSTAAQSQKQTCGVQYFRQCTAVLHRRLTREQPCGLGPMGNRARKNCQRLRGGSRCRLRP